MQDAGIEFTHKVLNGNYVYVCVCTYSDARTYKTIVMAQW